MARYWVQYPGEQTVWGGNTGYSKAEILGFIAQQLVLSDTWVSVNGGAWVAANQVSALQQAIANEICPRCSGKAFYERCYKCELGIIGLEGSPWQFREFLARQGTHCRYCYNCNGRGYTTTCPECGGSGRKRH